MSSGLLPPHDLEDLKARPFEAGPYQRILFFWIPCKSFWGLALGPTICLMLPGIKALSGTMSLKTWIMRFENIWRKMCYLLPECVPYTFYLEHLEDMMEASTFLLFSSFLHSKTTQWPTNCWNGNASLRYVKTLIKPFASLCGESFARCPSWSSTSRWLDICRLGWYL